MNSIVCFDEDGDVLIGETDSDNIADAECLRSIKRVMGRPSSGTGAGFNDDDPEEWKRYFQPCDDTYCADFPNLRAGLDQVGQTQLQLRPEVVSGLFLATQRYRASTMLQQSVVHAVITVPAHFNDREKEATLKAGQIAGLEVLGLLSEPVSAAKMWLHANKEEIKEQTIFVFDLGGGTLDVTALEISAEGVMDVSNAYS